MTAEELKLWRQRMGWIQQKAADELGVTKTTYQALERGTSFATGKPVKIDKRTILACTALEHSMKGSK